jgi:hypothetical protein
MPADPKKIQAITNFITANYSCDTVTHADSEISSEFFFVTDKRSERIVLERKFIDDNDIETILDRLRKKDKPA